MKCEVGYDCLTQIILHWTGCAGKTSYKLTEY